MADCTTSGPADRPARESGWQRPNIRPAPAPWEGPLVSDTTDLINGSSAMSEEPPTTAPWAGEAPGQAGASPAPDGAVRSWPDAASGAGETLRAGSAPRSAGAGAGRRGGTGLS